MQDWSALLASVIKKASVAAAQSGVAAAVLKARLLVRQPAPSSTPS